MDDVKRVADILSMKPLDVFETAHRFIDNEDIRDIIDPQDSWRMWVETGFIPDWVMTYCGHVIKVNKFHKFAR